MRFFILIFFIIIGPVLASEPLQIKLIIDKNDIINEYYIPVNELGYFTYGGFRQSYHKSNPENLSKDLGLSCSGKILYLDKNDEYFVEFELNKKDVTYHLYTNGKGENGVYLPSGDGAKFNTNIQIKLNELESLGGFMSKVIESKPGQPEKTINNSESVSIVIEKCPPQGDAPEPASPAR